MEMVIQSARRSAASPSALEKAGWYSRKRILVRGRRTSKVEAGYYIEMKNAVKPRAKIEG